MIRRTAASRRWLAAFAVFALLCAQTLGVWHHTVHAPGMSVVAGAPGAAAPGASTVAFAVSDADAGAAHDHFSAPLHHLSGSADCRLLDQLLLAHGAVAGDFAAPVLPLLPVHAAAWPVERIALAPAQSYQARGPPVRG